MFPEKNLYRKPLGLNSYLSCVSNTWSNKIAFFFAFANYTGMYSNLTGISLVKKSSYNVGNWITTASPIICGLLFEFCRLKPATLLKKRLWHRCFAVNFVKFLRTPFLQNSSGRLLLSIYLIFKGPPFQYHKVRHPYFL